MNIIEDDDSESNTEFEVEDIIKDREVKLFNEKTQKYDKPTNEYLIKWKGYNEQTWEPEENLKNCPDILKNYLNRKRKIEMIEKNITKKILKLNKKKQEEKSKIPYSHLPPSFDEVINANTKVTSKDRKRAYLERLKHLS